MEVLSCFNHNSDKILDLQRILATSPSFVKHQSRTMAFGSKAKNQIWLQLIIKHWVHSACKIIIVSNPKMFNKFMAFRTIFIDIPLIHTKWEIRTLNITVKFFAPLLGATTTSYITPIWTSLNDPWWWNTNLIPFIQCYHMVNNKHLQSTLFILYPSEMLILLRISPDNIFWYFLPSASAIDR